MTIKGFLNKVEKLNTDIAAINAIDVTKGNFIDQNKKQLYSGFTKKGERLKTYRSILYGEVKSRMNSLPGEGNPDLYLTGAFYSGITVDIVGESIRTFSQDSKGADLEAKYKDIFGLGNQFKVDYIKKFLRPEFIRRIKKQL